MRKKIDLRKNVCLLGAVIMLGACGQAESADPTTAATETETQAAETTADEQESADKDKDTAIKEEDGTESGEDAEEAKESKEADGTGNSTDKDESKEQDAEKDSGAVMDVDADSADGQPAQGAADGSTTQEAAEAAVDPAAPDTQQGGKSVAQIYEEISQKVSLNSPMIVPDDFIANYYGIDVSTLDEYVFSMSEAAISAETVVILKAKDSGSTGALSAALQTVIDQKRSEMENYLPDQFQIVDKSSVQVKGDHVYLVISEQAASIEQIIQAGIQ